MCFSDVVNSLYPFRLFAQETEHKISAWSHFTPSDYARVRTTYGENIAISDGGVRAVLIEERFV